MAHSVHREIAADGAQSHLVPLPPDSLPRVQKRDLERAWDAANDAARAGRDGPRRGFRFVGGLDVVLTDRDARAWAASIDRVTDLSTVYGVSVCLRLLGLVALIGDARWPARFVRIDRAGVTPDGALLAAAARTALTTTGALDEMAMCAMLLPRETEEHTPCPALP